VREIPGPTELGLADGETARVALGAIGLELTRQGECWLVTSPTDAAPGDHLTLMLGTAAHRGLLRPRLADRPLVARPPCPLALPGRARLTLAVQSPLWLGLEDVDGRALYEIGPTLASTWFGTFTDGELAYALDRPATSARPLPRPEPGRALTLVSVHNDARDAVELGRVVVPAPQLTLHQAADGRFWTQTVTLRRDEDPGHTDVRLGEGPPGEPGPTTLVAAAREDAPSRFLTRAFDSLLGRKR